MSGWIVALLVVVAVVAVLVLRRRGTADPQMAAPAAGAQPPGPCVFCGAAIGTGSARIAGLTRDAVVGLTGSEPRHLPSDRDELGRDRWFAHEGCLRTAQGERPEASAGLVERELPSARDAAGAPGKKPPRGEACDFCSSSAPVTCTYPPSTIRAVVARGFRPKAFEHGVQTGAQLGLPRSVFDEDFVRQVEEDTTDWAACRSCETAIDGAAGR